MTFLLLGALRPGKGVVETLRAFRSWVPPEGARTRLVLAGEVQPAFREALDAAVSEYRAARPVSGMELETGFLDEDAFVRHVRGSGFLLLPYTRPMGSSGILGHAAREGIPVLATCDGLIGSLVREYRLGATFAAASPSAVHSVLNNALARRVAMDPEGRTRYLEANSVEAFQSAVFGA